MLNPEDVPGLVLTGASAQRELDAAPQFKVGDSVTAKNIHVPGHNRIPSYIKGKRGVVDRYQGSFAYPDDAGKARPTGEAQHTYSVRFTASELWGNQHNDVVCISMFEDYLVQD
ncbi:MAG: SH3-like domain-containing protein [Porticoccaceae bacterium]